MTLLERDVAGSRVEAARAADLLARLLDLTREIDRMAKEEFRLAEKCGMNAADVESFRYSGLGEILRTFEPGMLVGHGAQVGKSATVTSLDQVLAVALVQREANLRSQAAARRERDEIAACRQTAWDTIALHRELRSQWIGPLARWDPGLGRDLVRLDGEERIRLQQLMRLEAAQTAAGDAEIALNGLWAALQVAVDWVRAEGASNESPTPVLCLERLKHAEPWIFEVQVSLARLCRALCGSSRFREGDYQVDYLSKFAGWCIESMGWDIAERDGTSRSSRTVSWTLTTVLVLRGDLTRYQGDAERALEDLRLRRTRMLSRTRS